MFNTFIYTPLYNALVYLVDIIPGGEVGLAVIALTILVRIVLFPLAQKSSRTQLVMQKLKPEIDKIKEKYKKDPQVQAQKTMALYREHKMNPFSGILLLIVQLPIIFGLYFIFVRGGLPSIDISHLYAFVSVPATIDMTFLGIPMAGKSVVLAALAGITQFVQINLLSAKLANNKPKNDGSMGDIMQKMQSQMKFTMPIIIAVVAYSLSALIALYFTTSNLFMIGQEWYIKKRNSI